MSLKMVGDHCWVPAMQATVGGWPAEDFCKKLRHMLRMVGSHMREDRLEQRIG